MKKTKVILIDDMDGAEAQRTVSFSFDGIDYEIDLSEENLARMKKTLDEWIAAGRRIGGRQRRRTSGVTAVPGLSAEVRAWAKKRGIAVSERGRIPAELVSQYHAENA
ncbi:histone-like nucleoid-structuring protein Lsr2 [Schaalia sp. lx-260]|uniref:histone-like nucleoid-structuring protein Lsr2 n=1 Tax=Schaalia sp. lx-260 TaxID=2899082 RepID=UPI001E5AD8EB|nr:Lsr2 family protein [Schaalia sp. lx-260]MCD4549963.1 Lsr2 family protein [Schaalia sp. lx-260]